MSRFYTATIADIRRETRDTVSIALSLPEDAKKEFAFKQGQYLTFKINLQGEEIRRTYSICSAPFEDELRIAVKKIEGGKFSTYANELLKVGDKIEVMPPRGNFYTELKPSQAKNYLAFAAGSGITPILSIIKTTLATEPQSTYTLIYGNKGSATIIFKEELEALKNKYINRFVLYHVFSRETLDVPLMNGRITAEKCRLFCKSLIDLENIDEVFLCGPGEMIVEVSAELEKLGFEKKHIHQELFTAPGGTAVAEQKKEIKKEFSGDVSHVTIILDGKQTNFDLATEGSNMLDAALQHGADVPFACKGAVCATCKAKVIEGKIEMEVNYSLTDEELASGYVLTCQSHPVTEHVVVSFDEV